MKTKIKVEEPSSKIVYDRKSAGPSTVTTTEKDEEQVGPTDLSQPNKRSQTPPTSYLTLNTTNLSSSSLSVSSAQHQKLFSLADGLSDNKQNQRTFLCNQCSAALPDFDSFRLHLKSHITQGITNLICHQCGISLRDHVEYERHLLSHFLVTSSEYTCSGNTCSKTFPKTDELQNHLFENHIQTIFKCTLCSDLFETKVAVQVHFACTHSSESKVYRCSACMESFRSEKDFVTHVRARHSNVVTTSIQCMFCRTVCSSELEMHFHLAAHARQFRCPSCPETFHVEFLLDRHMQIHHSQKENGNSISSIQKSLTTGNSQSQQQKQSHAYHNHHLNKISSNNNNKTNNSNINNNNNVLDYHAFATVGKGLFQLPTPPSNTNNMVSGNKFYNSLQVDTTANPLSSSVVNKHHPALIYGLSQRYFDANKTLLDMYNNYQSHQVSNPVAAAAAAAATAPAVTFENNRTATNKINSSVEGKTPSETDILNRNPGYSCGICERSDFRTEAEVHSHRKIVHNLKTGVSLKCAYCSGNFKSRNELEHHMKTCHNSTGKHKCLICDEVFPSPAILSEHKLQHSKVGQSGKCSHCLTPLNDVSAFKNHLSEHNTEGQTPVQCICCRQTLNSDFEISLHAKFHTKSSNAPENLCALCLEILPLNSETKVCDKCCRKHNLMSKFNSVSRYENSRVPSYLENRCNLCKMILTHPQRLQEHLVEHTFVGCEERGYSCYICSAVFTVPAGLLSHMNEHGQNARPYDCNICSEKYFFRAELDNHLIEHENNGKSNKTDFVSSACEQQCEGRDHRQRQYDRLHQQQLQQKERESHYQLQQFGQDKKQYVSENHSTTMSSENPVAVSTTDGTTAIVDTLAAKIEIKKEALEENEKINNEEEEEEEYIEVEKVPEINNIHVDDAKAPLSGEAEKSDE